MKTIEITSGDQKAQFTTKSVTFDGKEFFYAHMSNVINSTEKHVYSFTYDGEVKLLPYEEKDAKTLNAIFSQVQKLAAQKKADAAPEQTSDSAVSQKPETVPEKAEAPIQDTAAAPVRVTDVMNGSTKPPADGSKSDDKEKPKDGKSSGEKPEVVPEQKAKRKKSLTIFAVILAALLVCSVIYYFVFGTPSDPAPANPNASESQQYDDIDQLIDDLQ